MTGDALLNVKIISGLDLIKDDPVRPHIPTAWRIEDGREVYVLENSLHEPRAVICVAYTTDIPTTEYDLDKLGHNRGNIAVFYTVWSYDRGAGRDIVIQVANWINQIYNIDRFITLSPKTEMAERFHHKNGAVTLQTNSDTVNYEYTVV